MLTYASSAYLRFALFICVAIFLAINTANASQMKPGEVVVQYSIDVYDKDPTKEQVDELRRTLEAAKSPDASANYSALKMLAQEKFCKRYGSGKLIFTLAEGQSTSVQFVTGNSNLHIVAELVHVAEDSCEISFALGAAGNVTGTAGTSRSQGRSGGRTFPLDGTPTFQSGGGSKSFSGDGPGKSSHTSNTIRVWRRENADAPNTAEIAPDFGSEVMKRNMELELKRMSPGAPRFLRLDRVYDRLVLVHPSEYLDNLDVDDVNARLDNRSKNALDEISKVIKISDEQRSKIELTFRRRNSKWLKELDQFYLQTLSDPLAAGGRDSRDGMKEINGMLVQEFSATDSFVWRVMKTQFTDEQESELSGYFVRKFVGRFAGALDVSDGARSQLTGLLDERCKAEGGFALDEQEYLNWLLDREDSELVDLLGDERKAKELRSVARMSSNVKVFFWNVTY